MRYNVGGRKATWIYRPYWIITLSQLPRLGHLAICIIYWHDCVLHTISNHKYAYKVHITVCQPLTCTGIEAGSNACLQFASSACSLKTRHHEGPIKQPHRAVLARVLGTRPAACGILIKLSPASLSVRQFLCHPRLPHPHPLKLWLLVPCCRIL